MNNLLDLSLCFSVKTCSIIQHWLLFARVRKSPSEVQRSYRYEITLAEMCLSLPPFYSKLLACKHKTSYAAALHYASSNLPCSFAFTLHIIHFRWVMNILSLFFCFMLFESYSSVASSELDIQIIPAYDNRIAYTECFKNSLTTVKAYLNLFREHVQCLDLS
jgi:hypothetical protein